MNISQLEYLEAVVRHGGVRKAASILHVTPQAVSSAIKKLEAELGVELLNRDAKEITPTVEGREFALRAKTILLQIEALKQFAKTQTHGVSPDGHFRLYVPCLHGRGRLFGEGCYDSFVAQCPQIHLDVWHQPSAACFESLRMGISDAAVSLEAPSSNDLNYKNLGERELRVLVYCKNDILPEISIQELLCGRLAVPINLGPCLSAIGRCSEAQLQGFRFRDVEYQLTEQLAFLKSGGRILTFPESVISKKDDDVQECHIHGSKELSLPIFFCYRKGEWSERHRIVFWHLMESLRLQA